MSALWRGNKVKKKYPVWGYTGLDKICRSS